MASDFAANLIKNIVEQRSQLAGDSKITIEKFLESATQQAKHILSYGLNIAVHVSLVPQKCQCPNGKCQKAVEFEVWTMRVDRNTDSNNKSIMPIFLQQAILSQLYFSPFNSWLSDKPNNRLPKSHRCVYRITTSSSDLKSSKFSKLHSFPCCVVEKDSREALKIDVEWMSKSEFPELVECCESKKLNNEKLSNNQNNEDEAIIDDCPIQNTLTETHALANFSASSNPNPQLLLEKKRIRRNTTGCETEIRQSGRREVCKGSPVPWSRNQPNSLKQLNGSSPSSSGLLCNFEESALKGRLQPINSIEGFKLQLVIQDRFNTSPLELPMTTYFFNVSDNDTPSLYLGHCALNGKPIRISKHSTIQATIFNPQGLVVKIFIVPVNLNIPPNSKTFVRQRVNLLPKGLSTECAERSSLRFLIYLRFGSDQRGRCYIHTEIKMLFANKVDADVQNLVTGQKFHLVTSTECPKEPRFMPIKQLSKPE
ncbi:hypothetical protein M3Y97_00380400 [Aphelenchoides bicaudatus]|nr:hypothetical protein M3Y97_00380400 [Aphelenchoides bicaudatus]